jgi:hypothetical protein
MEHDKFETIEDAGLEIESEFKITTLITDFSKEFVKKLEQMGAMDDSE